jgi:signal peptide peptidase SppA
MKLLDVVNAPWAILPDRLFEIQAVYATHLRGDKIDLKGLEERLGEPLNSVHEEIEIIGGVAVIPIHGVIGKRMNLFSKISGGASTELVKRDIQIALDDGAVASIVLDIDSPGGSVDGIQELARFIFNARSEKPIVALANGMMASAAYWIGAAAHEIHISDGTAMVGSIGVVAGHVDVSKAHEMMGIKATEIVAGRFKRITSELAPLSESGRAEIQEHVDFIYSVFVKDVAAFRGVPVETVLENMADGRIFIGTQAVDAGLVDGVATRDQLIAELAGGLDLIAGSDQREASTHKQIALMKRDLESYTMNTFKAADLNLAFLAEHCPEVVAGIEKTAIDGARDTLLKEGNETGHTLGHAEGLAAGVTQETQRIKAVEDSLIPGHEALIQTLKFDGKTTGPEAAVQVIQAEQAGGRKALSTLESDAPKPLPTSEIDAGASDEQNYSALPIEERCKKEWDAKKSIRDEYVAFENYLSFEKNTGSIRIKSAA